MSSIVRQQDFKGGRAINAIVPRHALEQRPLSSAYKEARESRFTRVLAYAGHSFGSACHDVVAKPERRVRPYEEVDGKMMYFEDIQPGEVVHGPTFTIDRDEMVEFAKRLGSAAVSHRRRGRKRGIRGHHGTWGVPARRQDPASAPVAGAVGGDRRTRVRRTALSRSSETRRRATTPTGMAGQAGVRI